MPSSVGAVVTTYNGREDTLECLRALLRNSYSPCEILVMDNASADGTGEAVRREFPKVRYVCNETNIGYARSLNRGIRMSLDHDYVLVVSNDVIVADDLVDRLVKAAGENPSAGLCGPRMSEDDPDVHWAAGGRIDRWTGRVSHGKPPAGESAVEVDYVPGAVLLVRSDVFRKVGYFDPGFEAYYEDVDFCARLKSAGYGVLLVPGARIRHKVGVTLGKNVPRQKFLVTRNRLWFVRRNFAPARARLMAAADTLVTSIAFAKTLLLQGGRAALGMFRGYCAGRSRMPAEGGAEG